MAHFFAINKKHIVFQMKNLNMVIAQELVAREVHRPFPWPKTTLPKLLENKMSNNPSRFFG